MLIRYSIFYICLASSTMRHKRNQREKNNRIYFSKWKRISVHTFTVRVSDQLSHDVHNIYENANKKYFADHLEDALQTGCDKCTEVQQEKSTTVIDFLIKEKLDVWKKLTAKYDPDGVWRKKYEAQAKEKGIIIPQD